MEINWLHLVVVHIPVLGSLGSIVLLFVATRRKEVAAFKLAYWSIMLAAVFAGVAYFSGPPAAEYLETQMSVSQELLEDHALWSRIGFTLMMLVGAGGLVAILSYAQDEIPHKLLPKGLLMLLVIVALIFAYSSHLGGLIRRPDLF